MLDFRHAIQGTVYVLGPQSLLRIEVQDLAQRSYTQYVLGWTDPEEWARIPKLKRRWGWQYEVYVTPFFIERKAGELLESMGLVDCSQVKWKVRYHTLP